MITITKSQAIKKFLTVKTLPDLAERYNLNMECQVNVASDGGERIEDTYRGRKWQGWTDGLTTWKAFRIPYKASTNPEYTDRAMQFDLATHAEAIGMTGWDWKNKVSKWVAYDFDSLVGHSEKHLAKLSPEELNRVTEEARKIDWVTIRRSTSGKGLHLYVDLPDVPTENHNEHAALARSILGTMCALTGFNFSSKVDVCGSNMWVYHRKMEGTNGLTIEKPGTVLEEIPKNWRDHVKVVTGSRRKNLPQDIEKTHRGDIFEELTSKTQQIALDREHSRLIDYLKTHEHLWWWDQDAHMLVTHTYVIQKAHEELCLKGFFQTDSKGSNTDEQNCFLFPIRKGAWSIRRFTPGVTEHSSWEQDGSGWTRTYVNMDPDFSTACRAFNGLEDPKGGFIFQEAEVAAKAAKLLGVELVIDNKYAGRWCTLKQHKDGRLIISVERQKLDNAADAEGWLAKDKEWVKIESMQYQAPLAPEAGNYDDVLRHLVSQSNDDMGWVLKSNVEWCNEPMAHVKVYLASLGMTAKEVTNVLGSSVSRCWRIVNKPFQPEYPGDREWNRNAAQLRFLPHKGEERKYPHWEKILKHCGSGMDEAVKKNGWARANGVLTGADYLKLWCASIFTEPLQPLPYLFFHGPENSGKSIFHEALGMLLTKGRQQADTALLSQAGFNGELEGAILCVVEETDLREKNKVAHNRIKNWVTGLELHIHTKGKTPYHVPNSTHWVQCANDHRYCPIFEGDTRITMSFVESLDPLAKIPKRRLMIELEKEAPQFLADILDLDIPETDDRLNIPIIVTESKQQASQNNLSEFEQYLNDHCVWCAGGMIKLSQMWDRFMTHLDPVSASKWSKKKMSQELPPRFLKGRYKTDAQHYYGNICWAGEEVVEGKRLVINEKGFFTEVE